MHNDAQSPLHAALSAMVTEESTERLVEPDGLRHPDGLRDPEPPPIPEAQAETAAPPLAPDEAAPEPSGRPRTITARYPAFGPAAWGAVEDGRVQRRRMTQRLFGAVTPPPVGPPVASAGEPPAEAFDVDLTELEGDPVVPSQRPIVVPPPTLIAERPAVAASAQDEQGITLPDEEPHDA